VTEKSFFKKAERKQAKIKLLITGPAGSGKTFSALRLATGIGGRIAVIDTENGSASLYSDNFAFDVLTFPPPFTTERYISAITNAEKCGYHVLVIDSITHAWAGEGGLLEQKEKLDGIGKGSSYTNWATITKKHEAFKAAILQSSMHVVCTVRSKQDYILQENDKGKAVPRKIGLAPVQRDGLEYEFSIVFDVAMSHDAEVSKDRTGLFTDQIIRITEQTGKTIKDWLNTIQPSPNPPGNEVKPPVNQSVEPTPTETPKESDFVDSGPFPFEKPDDVPFAGPYPKAPPVTKPPVNSQGDYDQGYPDAPCTQPQVRKIFALAHQLPTKLDAKDLAEYCKEALEKDGPNMCDEQGVPHFDLMNRDEASRVIKKLAKEVANLAVRTPSITPGS